MTEAWEYQICLDEHLSKDLSDHFGLALEHTPTGQTLLSGTITDQAALHGILARVRDLGLTLVAIQRLGQRVETPGGTP
jgi:hypothetical protein